MSFGIIVIANKQSEKSCPKCGNEMVLRTAKKGVSTGIPKGELMKSIFL
jgi:predicted RNA-binding Zn-ribbon protein involved in translation (DUF1610 family)